RAARVRDRPRRRADGLLRRTPGRGDGVRLVTPADLIGFGKQLGERISVTSLLPGLTLALLVLALIWSGAPADAPDVGALTDRAETLSARDVGLLVLAIAILTLLSQPLQLSLVRLLDGHRGTPRLGTVLAAPGVARH